MVENSLQAYGYGIDEDMKAHFQEFRKTHNQGVFDAYTPEIRMARHTGLITGLPDAYGRGRIIGDYRRVALYGVDYLIQKKEEDKRNLKGPMLSDVIQLREEVSEQIKALKKMKEMAATYDYDLSNPATSAQEALQHIYFAYLAGAKENNGAATSLGRVSTFVDIYMERDLASGKITEMEAQELVDQFIMKLRLIRHLRTPSYDELFAGDPTWVTESIGGMGIDGRSLVTKTSYRFLQSLYNLGAAPEPNLTVLWSSRLPENFKKFCAKVSIDTNAIQYESDSLMREMHGDDYGIACCVSAMSLGKEMQFFGARCNLAKALLYAINGGRDEFTGALVVPDIPLLEDEQLDFFQVWENLKKVIDYVAELYVQANNIIHYMHDKYAYEASQMALHDTNVKRLMAFGIAGFSVAVDSLSAINFARVYPIRDENNLAVDFRIDGNFPKFGNDDDRVDSMGKSLVKSFTKALRKYPTYRDAKHTLSILTITSNVVYGKKTGSTPDGRKEKEPFAPGANPMHGRDQEGPLASLNSVAKLPYDYCEDGISNTFSIVPSSLGSNKDQQIFNLVAILTGYFKSGGHHLNVNVLNRETLEDAIEHPENYPTLTIRISGYAVMFNSLTKEQKREVLMRTFHEI
jgi:formate C-acetyltransferase